MLMNRDLKDCEKRPANHANDTNGNDFIRVICVIRGPKVPIERFVHIP